jgi:hypothetical protein
MPNHDSAFSRGLVADPGEVQNRVLTQCAFSSSRQSNEPDKMLIAGNVLLNRKMQLFPIVNATISGGVVQMR